MRRNSLTLTLVVCAIFAVGCGGQGEDQGSHQGSHQGGRGASGQGEEGRSPAEAQGGGEEVSPVAAAYYAKRLAQNFPLPKPTAARGSKRAIEAGRDACRGKTPLQIKEEFISRARLDSEQKELVEELPKYEAEASKDTNFVAGQLAALVYEATLPAGIQDYGFQGCVYELARKLGRSLR